MHLWGLGSRSTVDDFHNEAIRLIIPLLDPSRSAAATDVLLATAVLLRMSEQFSEPAEDAQCHMNGAFSLFTSSMSKWSPNRVDTQGVSFWVFVRQSLRVCFLFEQECRFDLSMIDDSDMLSSARDDVWTNRMSYLLAKLCHVCWSTPKPEQDRQKQFTALEAEVESWRNGLPSSFEPWYSRHGRSNSFPTIRYFTRWHGNSPLSERKKFPITNILG
jgi:hypothetical protein